MGEGLGVGLGVVFLWSMREKGKGVGVGTGKGTGKSMRASLSKRPFSNLPFSFSPMIDAGKPKIGVALPKVCPLEHSPRNTELDVHGLQQEARTLESLSMAT